MTDREDTLGSPNGGPDAVEAEPEDADRPTRPSKGRRKIRRATLDDVPGIYACQAAAYASFPEVGLCSERLLRMQIEAFPEGQIVAERGSQIIGYATSLIVHLGEESPWHSYSEITGNGTFSTHDPSGDTLYGADVAVHPDHRGKGLAGRIYEARKKILRRFNLRRMVAGGRIPGYKEHAGRMSAEEYVAKVTAGELSDPALNAHLKAGYRVQGVYHGYLRDEQSLNYATLIEMDNPKFRPERRRIASTPIARPVRKVRVCGAQYEVRRISSWEDFERQVDFFVSTADMYHSHFLLFPELFTAQLFSTMPMKAKSRDTMARLADMTERYIEMFKRMATESGLYIIGGSQPVWHADGKLHNVAHLFAPSGDVYTQDKLHITPAEREDYGISPGDGLHIFETPLARIAILVCYDVEFPELARLLTLAGAEILFVPFSTDERKAYLRVRYTAQARAVENMIYVVLAGNVGNLPQVDSFLINYGHAAVLTPSDFAFPTEAVAAAADSNSETVIITDLDLSSLEMQREVGSVRPLRDRRSDLYEVQSHIPITRIRTT